MIAQLPFQEGTAITPLLWKIVKAILPLKVLWEDPLIYQIHQARFYQTKTINNKREKMKEKVKST